MLMLELLRTRPVEAPIKVKRRQSLCFSKGGAPFAIHFPITLSLAFQASTLFK